MKKTLCSSSAHWIITGWVMVLFMRIVETILLKQSQSVSQLFWNESIGFIFDIVFISSVLAILFPVYYLFSRVSFRASNIFMGIILVLFSATHLAIIQYFVKELRPLGGILFEHTLHETFFTTRHF